MKIKSKSKITAFASNAYKVRARRSRPLVIDDHPSFYYPEFILTIWSNRLGYMRGIIPGIYTKYSIGVQNKLILVLYYYNGPVYV